ncbi:ATP-dependent RecD-like DNA helicase [Dokdonia sp. Hel_I_53]|uniref:ATP-dependent DNA helicase n=1 Tax=Dokdonia sp. Hel_I_53 TaxID=1566287 RepID=UPI00119B2569|nr:AAA family ATPase [Dokdonia sp. Hel_I_53]TVZ51323.1 exodeoxyribonuclease-5 [Dokdonia sp. Hel_I_53]
MVKDAPSFYKQLYKDFEHTPTLKQDRLLQQLATFLFDTNKDKLFVLKGFAGTGKTTVIGTVVKNLWHAKMSSVLMAPTGRAAKVASNYSKKQAFTIHRKIYFPKKERGGGVSFSLQPNKHRNCLFIVDEASMISDRAAESKFFDNGSLLDDMMQYIYSGYNCKLLLVGDEAQLPPVKLDISPALDIKNLSLHYNKQVETLQLDEVMRQAEGSGILMNATALREQLSEGFYEDFKFDLNGFDDIIRLVDGHEIMDAINDGYSKVGTEETAIIVRSNKRANLYNQQIRSRILFQEEEISAGDHLMVVKNNYFWLDAKSDAGFIANGDIIKILEILAIKELYGFRFAEIKAQMVDYPHMQPIETVIMLDVLTMETPALPYEMGDSLYKEVQKDYVDEKSNYKRFQKIKNNKYFNALQVKFSYAITCHKSQGGQWENVFIEQPYLPDGMSKDYLRWLYTAITRSKSRLYLIGFKDEMFIEN